MSQKSKEFVFTPYELADLVDWKLRVTNPKFDHRPYCSSTRSAALHTLQEGFRGKYFQGGRAPSVWTTEGRKHVVQIVYDTLPDTFGSHIKIDGDYAEFLDLFGKRWLGVPRFKPKVYEEQ